MAILVIMLSQVTNPVITGIITFPMVLLPGFIIIIFNKSVLSYLKLDLVLRLITRFYVRKKIPV